MLLVLVIAGDHWRPGYGAASDHVCYQADGPLISVTVAVCDWPAWSVHPGDSVTIGWTDQAGQTHTATVTLINGPAA